MKRKEFLKKGLIGSGLLLSSSTFAKMLPETLKNNPLEKNLGFNHIPLKQTNIMDNTVLHTADSRGIANHGWLQSKHSFSFASYYNPNRMHFGVLRVLNDDIVAPGKGFNTHPHDNMEIISIPLEGDLEHKDSMGNVSVIRSGDIQVMSAGTGIYHSEYNKNKDKDVKFLQIWVFPNKKNVSPRYDQISLNKADRKNKIQQILSPNKEDEGVWIHQNAWFHLAEFDAEMSQNYKFKSPNNGLYIFVLNGKIQVDNQVLNTRDGYGVWATASAKIKAINRSDFLLMEVPMSL